LVQSAPGTGTSAQRAIAIDITLSPDDSKPPSPEIAELLGGYGLGDDPDDRK
jgi:hypothetical protein